ncbi:hypothetical protein HYN43_029435 [Mucilaginibacter celer]|uniref:Uncharacterized protein n=1 Tax=Mucilaginibacter celer TaxID=2305508 RepID=A0A494W755_9SPHI|nr:hypothetical protein HYN43_029435 [Mucilaginibacter celer]
MASVAFILRSKKGTYFRFLKEKVIPCFQYFSKEAILKRLIKCNRILNLKLFISFLYFEILTWN